MVEFVDHHSSLEQSSDSKQENLTPYQLFLKQVKTLENQLRRAGMKWYKVYGSHLNPDLAETLGEKTGLSRGFEMAMQRVTD